MLKDENKLVASSSSSLIIIIISQKIYIPGMPNSVRKKYTNGFREKNKKPGISNRNTVYKIICNVKFFADNFPGQVVKWGFLCLNTFRVNREGSKVATFRSGEWICDHAIASHRVQTYVELTCLGDAFQNKI